MKPLGISRDIRWCEVKNMGIFENIEALSKYKQLKNILGKNGQIFSTKAQAFKKDTLIYDGKVQYSISYNAGYEQYQVSIIWDIPQISANAMELHGGYNTNFQSFRFENSPLLIEDKDIKIILY